MKNLFYAVLAVLLIIPASCTPKDGGFTGMVKKTVALPAPAGISMDLSGAMKKRRTIRKFDDDKAMTIQELSEILFAMQGLTDGRKRTVPSAYGVYPLELYIVATGITGLEDGMYRMDIKNFTLQMCKKGDFTGDIHSAAGQRIVKKAEARIVITCVWERLTSKMGEESRKWGYFEAGGASQNGFLVAAAMGIHTVPVGGMDPDRAAKAIGVDGVKETPIIINCFGR